MAITSVVASAHGERGVEINEVRVVNEQQDHVVDASESHSVSSNATTNTALNALGVKVNEILTVLESHGLVASS